MEATAQREAQLHKSASENLQQAGYNVTPSSLNPDDQTALENIKGTLGEGVHVVGSEIGRRLRGQDIETDVGVTPAGRWKRLVDRLRRIKWK